MKARSEPRPCCVWYDTSTYRLTINWHWTKIGIQYNWGIISFQMIVLLQQSFNEPFILLMCPTFLFAKPLLNSACIYVNHIHIKICGKNVVDDNWILIYHIIACPCPEISMHLIPFCMETTWNILSIP